MIKQKDFIGSKLTFIFQVSYSCLIKSINRKRLLHSSLPSGYSFIITSQILLLLQLQLESFRMIHSQVGQNFTVHVYISFMNQTHKFRIRQAFQTDSCINSLNPQCSKF